MGGELRFGYRDDLPFFNIDLAQMKPLKEPLCVKETTVLPKRTVCLVTVENNKSEGNVISPMGTGRALLRAGPLCLPASAFLTAAPIQHFGDEDLRTTGATPCPFCCISCSGARRVQVSFKFPVPIRDEAHASLTTASETPSASYYFLCSSPIQHLATRIHGPRGQRRAHSAATDVPEHGVCKFSSFKSPF
ncbi:hypothetical protein HPB50_011174 [Hyalomma asiaticum]|uniref:Uncharacterized protein n=1 Tax=Hyalomma asiaticum TaxID=266040 RepID=A0ACB7RQI0_HYAAI|nr:hypothetical protein HPB50_011174 [Hyalomma asiaticum]